MYNPKAYQKSNVAQKRDVLTCSDKYTPKLKWKEVNNRIIDIGCGDGSITSLLEKFLPDDFKLLGCDISEDMVMFANEHYGNEHTSFLVLDIAGELPESMKRNFHQVFSFNAINWVLDQKRAFGNIFNLLEQQGECILLFVANHGLYDVYRALSRTSKWSPWVYDVDKYISPYHDSEKPDEEVMELMRNIGFVNIEVECKDETFRFDIDTMRQILTALNPFDISMDKYDEFIEDSIERFKDIKNSREVDTSKFVEGVTMFYKTITVYGQKEKAAEIGGIESNFKDVL